MLAADDSYPPPTDRPWSDLTRERSERDGPYADFSAWESWFAAVCDDTLPGDTPDILDTLDYCQKAYLYDIMARLADGEAPPWAGPAPAATAEALP